MDQIALIREDKLLQIGSIINDKSEAETAPGPSSAITEENLNSLKANTSIKTEVSKVAIERQFLESNNTDISKDKEVLKLCKKSTVITTEKASAKEELVDKIRAEDNVPNLWEVDDNTPGHMRALSDENAYLARVLDRLVTFLPPGDPALEEMQQVIDEALTFKSK